MGAIFGVPYYAHEGASRRLYPPGQTEARMDPVPDVGEHSRSLLLELGYGAQQVEQMAAQGVVGCSGD